MDPFFSSDQDEFQNLWDLSMDPAVDLLGAVTQHISRPPSPVGRRSAFSKYEGSSAAAAQASNSSSMVQGGDRNIHRRIIRLLRRIWRENREGKGGGGDGGGSSRGGRVFRHMMRERQRRERLSQGYADLYAMLSPRPKADKNSIVQTADALVRELKGVKEGLHKRNEDLMKMAAPTVAMAEEMSARIDQNMEVGGEGVVITAQVENSTSAIDSVIAALRSLERTDVKARAIMAEFAGGDDNGMTGGVMKIETNKRNGALKALEKMLAVEGWRSLK